MGGEARGQTAAVRGGDQGQRQVSPQISPPSPPSLPSLPAPPERPVGEPEGAHDEEADYPPPLATQGWGVPPQQLVPFLPPPAVRLVTVAPGQKGGKGAAGADPALLAAEAGRPDQLRPFARGSPLAPGRHQSPMGLATQQQESTGGAEQWEEELIARERREMAEPARTGAARPLEAATTSTSRGPNPPPAQSSQSLGDRFEPRHPWPVPPGGALPLDHDRREAESGAGGDDSGGAGEVRGDRRRRHRHRRHQPRAEEGLTDSQLAALVRSL